MKQQTVLVVGGARGIGKAVTESRLLKGDKVVFTDIDQNTGMELMTLWQSQGYDAHFIAHDVTSFEKTTAVMKETSTSGGLDVMVISAGITSQKTLHEITKEDWRITLDVNLTGLFYCLKTGIPEMVKAGGGSIVIVGSGSAVTGSGGGMHYAASKGGAFGLMRAAAGEYSAKGIHINLVAPRVIETEMLDVLYPTEVEKEALRRKIPIGQFGTLADTTNVINFLTEESARYIQAQIILMDGGRTHLS